MLLVRFALPCANAIGAENIVDHLADLQLDTVTVKLVKSPSRRYVVFKCVYKLLVRFHAVDTRE